MNYRKEIDIYYSDLNIIFVILALFIESPDHQRQLEQIHNPVVSHYQQGSCQPSDEQQEAGNGRQSREPHH
jgi:hypothetical protein